MLKRCLFLFVAIAFSGTQTTFGQSNAQAPAAAKPRLVVLLIFDQMRADYLTRWHDLFEQGGFRRLLDQGAWFQNCHFPYGRTVTAVGHASIVTGCTPAIHGIVGNEWYDRKQRDAVSAVRVQRDYFRVGVPDTYTGKESKNGPKKDGVSPERLLAPTIADALKDATHGKAKVVALSLKDRSAVLPAGRRPDACYWFDTRSGCFVTSSYYRDSAHPWVEDFNRSRTADRWRGLQWNRLRADLDYVKYSGPDDVAGEGTGYAQGRVFPHPLESKLGRAKDFYYDALTTSPFGNELLLEFAGRAIDAEKLGRHDNTDFLSISFSSNDLIGHCWGPDSQEVLDVTLRSDLILKELFGYLDRHIGKGHYVAVLTADHGVCPIPEVAQSRGQDAGRIDLKALTEKADEYLDKRYRRPQGRYTWFDSVDDAWVYFDPSTIKASGKSAHELERAVADWLKTQPGILTAYTRSQLTGELPANDAIGRRVQRSFHAERCGDVAIVQKPGYLFTDKFTTGTTHGTPHPYDTHVPLLVYGPGVRTGTFDEPVTPLAAAAILAHWLGIAAPAKAEYPVPRGLLLDR